MGKERNRGSQQMILPHSVVQGALTDVERLGSFGPVIVVLLKGLADAVFMQLANQTCVELCVVLGLEGQIGSGGCLDYGA